MINGILGMLAAIGLLVTLPLERWLGPLGSAPADFFLILLIATAWPLFMGRRIRLDFPLALAFWLILGGGLIGALSALDPATALSAMAQELYLFAVLVTVVNVFVDKKSFATFCKGWIIVAAVESVLLIMGRLRIGPALLHTAPRRLVDVSEIGHSLGTFQSTNAAGGYMLVSTFILLAASFPRSRMARAGLLALYATAIFATGSNGALLGLLVGLVVVILYWSYRRGRTMVLALGMGSLVASMVILLQLLWPVILPLYGPVERENLMFAYSRVGNKLEKRVEIWGAALAAYEEHPLGIGPNVTKTVAGGSMHNDFLAFAVERGPLGFIGLMVMIGQILYWLALASKHSIRWSHQRATGAFLGGLASILVLATSHEVTHGRSIWLLFAVIFLHCKFLYSEAERPWMRLAGNQHAQASLRQLSES